MRKRNCLDSLFLFCHSLNCILFTPSIFQRRKKKREKVGEQSERANAKNVGGVLERAKRAKEKYIFSPCVSHFALASSSIAAFSPRLTIEEKQEEIAGCEQSP